MQRKSEGSIQRKMADLRLVCDQEIRIHQQKADSAMNSFRNCLQSVKIRAEESIGDQEKLVKAKNHLRELEDDLVEALADYDLQILLDEDSDPDVTWNEIRTAAGAVISKICKNFCPCRSDLTAHVH